MKVRNASHVSVHDLPMERTFKRRNNTALHMVSDETLAATYSFSLTFTTLCLQVTTVVHFRFKVNTERGTEYETHLVLCLFKSRK